MKNENLSLNKTVLRVIYDPSQINIFQLAKQNIQCSRVFVPPQDHGVAFITYKTQEGAEIGLKTLRHNPAIKVITFGIQSIRATVTPQNGNEVMPPTPAMAYPAPEPVPELPKCAKCFAWPVVKRCGVCGTCYCDVNCQRQDWPQHKEICMPTLFVDPALEALIFTITAEQKMRYYAEHRPPIVPDAPNPPVEQEILNEPADLHEDRHHPYRQPADLAPQKKPSVQHGKKQQNNKLLPQQESARKQSQQDQELRQKQPQKEANKKQLKQESHKPKQRQSQQEPKQNQLKQELQQKTPKKQSEQEPQQNGLEQKPKQKSPQSQPQQVPPKEQQQLLNQLPLRALVARAREDSKRKELQQASFPSLGSTVKIAHVAENTMFVFEAGSDSTGLSSQYGKVVERCFVGGEASKKYVGHAPVPGDIVYAPFEEVYYRAEVNSVERDTAIVFFTDFGNTETLEWKNFKEIEDPEIKYADRLIHEVQIENLPTFTEFVRMELQALEGEAFELSKVVDLPNSKAKMVELRHPKELYYLSEMIRKRSKDNDELKKQQMAPQVNNIEPAEPAVVPPDPESYVPVSIAELSEVCIPYGNSIELMIIDAAEVYDATSRRLAVIDIARNDAFAKVLAEVREYGDADSNVYAPEELHHLCLVQWDGIWSRAVPLAIGSKGDTSSPYCLLDLGIIKTVESTHVRRFPHALSRKLYVTDCIVQNPETLCKLATEGVQNTELLTGLKIKVNVIPKENASDEIQEIRIISVH